MRTDTRGHRHHNAVRVQALSEQRGGTRHELWLYSQNNQVGRVKSAGGYLRYCLNAHRPKLGQGSWTGVRGAQTLWGVASIEQATNYRLGHVARAHEADVLGYFFDVQGLSPFKSIARGVYRGLRTVGLESQPLSERQRYPYRP